jgi:hypothetical protein
MSEPAVILRFDGNGRTYQPSEVLAGEYRLADAAGEQVKAIEVSVLWYSEGKGEPDMAVHEFWRLDPDSVQGNDLARPQRFSTTLPQSPLSYDGLIVKIRWCVRVRAFLQRGRELVGQKVFRLGNIAAPKAPPEPKSPEAETP